MSSADPARRFGPEFVAATRAKYEHTRQRTQRPLSYDIAVNDEYGPWRSWLDEQFACLPEETAAALEKRLWPDEHFWPTMIELATGAGLRAAGLQVEYERRWGTAGLTPDWTVVDEAGNPRCFVEVHTDEPARGSYGAMRRWHELSQRIAEIPVSVILLLDPRAGNHTPPDSGQSKQIAKSLRAQLMSSGHGGRFEAHGYCFVVHANRYGPEPSPHGLRACFDPPNPNSGPVTATNLVAGIERKVKRYRELADEFEMPLMVAVGAHKFTGVSWETFENLLEGRPTMTFQFNLGDTSLGSQTLNMDQPPSWTMPTELSAVMWVSNSFPCPVKVRRNSVSDRPLPEDWF